MPTINVRLAILEKRQSENVTGTGFTIEYANGKHAEISMMEMPAVSGSAPFEGFRAELDQLGKKIQDAAEFPENILWCRSEPG